MLDHLFPVAVQRGTTQSLQTPGTFDPWPVRFVADTPGIQWTVETNKARVTVTLASDVPTGPHLVWAYHDSGASSPRFLIVTDDAQATEQEPNDDYRKPQALRTFPTHLNGRLEKSGDVDCFSIPLNAGQTVVAELEAYTLMTGLDGLLRLTDHQGNQVAWNHDQGRSLDPRLVWTAPVAGTYVLQVMGFVYPAGSDVKLHGSEKTVYRLHVYTGPFVAYTLPLGVASTGDTPLRPVGWNLESRPPQPFVHSGLRGVKAGDDFFLTIPKTENPCRILAGVGAESMEQEPNDSPAQAMPIRIPEAVTGALDSAGDQDRFEFAAKKGEPLLFSVQSSTLGFPADPWLEIQDPTGKVLLNVDDTRGADPETVWTAAADGNFQVVIGNRLHRGSSEHRYRLKCTRPQPDCQATVASATFALKPGATNELKVTVNRQYGHTNSLTAEVVGLPPGIRAAPVVAREKTGELTLSLVAATNAPSFNGRIQIHLRGSNEVHAATFEFVSSGENNGVPQGFKDVILARTDQVWLTVTPPETPPAMEPKK